MNIMPMFDINQKLNNYKTIDPELDLYKLRVRKLLEFEISLGELATSTNCYAYSNDTVHEINRDLVLQKYLNCISKLITLGIDHNYTDINNITFAENENCLSDQFLNLYIDINDLIVSPCRDHYTTLFEDLLSVGNLLGFSEDYTSNEFISRFSL